jgi:hypothetical protein
MPWQIKRAWKTDKAMETTEYNRAMTYSIPNPDVVTELRYALDVMEEYSHLGLDNEAADKLRRILLRRIDEAEGAISCRPAAPVRFPLAEAKISA